MVTRAEAIARAGQVLAAGIRMADSMTPRELAEASWHAGCPFTVDQLEVRVGGAPPAPAAPHLSA